MHQISELLCETYGELYRRGQVQFPLHDEHREAIDSVVKTVNANYFGVQRFSAPVDRAVAYLCLIIKDHPVTDGNKRLAVLWFRIYCDIRKLKPNPSVAWDELAVAIEQSELKTDQLMGGIKFVLFN